MTVPLSRIDEAIGRVPDSDYSVSEVLDYSLGYLYPEIGELGLENRELARSIAKAVLLTDDLEVHFTNFPPTVIHDAVLAAVGALSALHDSHQESVASFVDDVALDEQYRRYQDGTLANYIP